MKFKLKNSDLVGINNFLYSLKLKGKASRSRSKLVNLVLKKIKECDVDKDALVKDYANLNSEGNPVVIGDSYDIPPEKIHLYKVALAELFEEIVTIEGGEYFNQIEDIKLILEKYDGELEAQDAEAYNNLLDAFEAAEIK